MNSTNGNGQIAGNNLPAKTQINNATYFIAEQAASPVYIPVSTPDQPDGSLPLLATNQTTIYWTEFADAKATRLTAHSGTWADLIERVRNVGTFDSKAKCPWIKLATFGNQRSEKRSLRHDANVLFVYGVEGDYDAELVTMDQAINMLERHGIRAAVYPSPSSTAEKPRWRAMCPLAQQHPPNSRAGLVARLNGALDGILAVESFVLSQSYYFGALATNDYRVLVTWDDPDDGRCIDELDKLDAVAIGKPSIVRKSINGAPLSIGAEMFEDAVSLLGRLLKSGDGRRDMLKSYIASRSARATPIGDLRAMVKGLAAEYFDPSDPMDAKNIEEIIGHFVTKDNNQPAMPSPLHGTSIDPETGEILDHTLHQPSEPDPPTSTDATTTTDVLPRATYPPPFRGVMRDAVESALFVSSKPQPDLCILSTLIGMAASCNGIYSLPSGMRLNLYGDGVAGTGEGKEAPRQIATTIVRLVNGLRIGKPASGPGLEDCLVSYRGTLVSLDEIAHFFAAINNGKAPPHLIELAGLLLQMFSTSSSQYITRVRAVSKDTIPQRTLYNPVISILGFATPEKLGEAMGVSNVEDGLLGRFLFAFGQEGVIPRRVTSKWEVPQSVIDAAEAITAAIPLCASFPDHKTADIPIEISPDAETRLGELMIEFDQQRRNSSSAFAKALLTRSCEKCERVAGVLAVWDSPRAPVITLEHLTWAEQLLRASDAALLLFSGEYMLGGQTQADANKVLTLVKRALTGDFKTQKKHEGAMLKMGTAPYSMVMRASKLEKRRFDDAVAHLIDLSDVRLDRALSKHPNGREESIRGLSLCG